MSPPESPLLPPAVDRRHRSPGVPNRPTSPSSLWPGRPAGCVPSRFPPLPQVLHFLTFTITACYMSRVVRLGVIFDSTLRRAVPWLVSVSPDTPGGIFPRSAHGITGPMIPGQGRWAGGCREGIPPPPLGRRCPRLLLCQRDGVLRLEASCVGTPGREVVRSGSEGPGAGLKPRGRCVPMPCEACALCEVAAGTRARRRSRDRP